MSIMAFNNFKWYDNSIEYLWESINLFKTLSNQERGKLPSDFENNLLRMKSYLPAYHNDMLAQGNLNKFSLNRFVVALGIFVLLEPLYIKYVKLDLRGF